MKTTKRQLRKIIREALSHVREASNRDDLMDAVKNTFGLKHVRTTEEFDGTPGGVWLSAEEGTLVPGSDLPLFDYYLDVDPYVFGIHPDFEAFVVDRYGFAPEWNDPGTLMLWPLEPYE